MKNLIIVLCFLISAKPVFSNKIDKLKTDQDVAAFIVSLDTMFHQKYSPRFIVHTTQQILSGSTCGALAKKIGVKNWVKTDFNNDGRTDLLVNGYYDNYTTFIAIDNGHNNFKLIILQYSSFNKCEFSTTRHIGKDQLVLFYADKSSIYENHPSLKHQSIDTLCYKFGYFIEHNNSSDNYKIDSIIFHSGPCYGTCPDFSIKIDRHGNATYIAGMWSKKQGTFTSSIPNNELLQIDDIVNYIHIKKLNDRYAVPWTDDATCRLTVKFSDGTVKTISDYGEIGTYGLRALYSIFFNMTTHEDWK